MAADDASIDLDALRSSVAVAGVRTARLVAGVDEPGRRLPGSDWTVADVAAHLAAGTDAYAAYLTGDHEPRVDLSDLAGGSLAASNAGNLAAEPDRDLDVLAPRIEAGVGRLLDLTAPLRAGDTAVWHGRDVPVETFLASSLAELLIHGRDVALAVGRPWPIAAEDARAVVLGMAPVLCLVVNPSEAAGVRVTYDVRLRGGGRLTLRFHDGALDARAGAPERADCHVSADPVAFLLVAYGRQGQWPAIARGKLTAWGRRPWWALRLQRMMVSP